MSHPTFSFSLSSPSRYGPRLGNIVLKRPAAGNGNGSESVVVIATPGFLATTSRGAVPHLSRDHVRSSDAIRWVNVPFETFLEHNPPVPTLQAQQPGEASKLHPLHTFLGFVPAKHIVSMSLRDPHDAREMPPNGNAHVCAYSLRGVRKVSPADWRAYTEACQPDIVFALSDTPYTDPPYSQKRLTKSIERSAAWVASLLGPTRAAPPPTSHRRKPKQKTPASETAQAAVDSTTTGANTGSTDSARPNYVPSIFVHLAGLTSHGARKAFADSLLEPLFGAEAEAIKPHKTLDEGIAGYVVDLVPLRASVAAARRKVAIATTPTTVAVATMTTTTTPNADADADAKPTATATETATSTTTTTTPTTTANPAAFPDAAETGPSSTSAILPLLHTSLAPLPLEKPRLLMGVGSPHEILRYIGHGGADLFDAGWAQRAADVGVALDFVFPVRRGVAGGTEGKKEIGANLYDVRYRLDFGPLADTFRGAFSADADKPVCPCAACSPLSPATRIYHGYDAPSVTGEQGGEEEEDGRHQPHYTRAYLHHLLHMHEMSAHALLALHNLAVVDAFFAGIRGVIARMITQTQTESISPTQTSAESETISQTQMRSETQAADAITDDTRDATRDATRMWDEEVKRFEAAYDARLGVLEAARERWREVDLARGKGRLAREKEKQGPAAAAEAAALQVEEVVEE